MEKPKKQKLKKPVWLKYEDDEVRAIILNLAKKGLTSEKIGLALRDQYGIPSAKIYKLSIKEVLGSKFKDPDIANIELKLKKITEHFNKNHQDKKAKRALIITKAKLKKIQDYQKQKVIV